MDERKLNIQQREKIKYLELQNQKLEKIVLKQSNEFKKAKDKLEEQVAERTIHLKEQKEQLQAIHIIDSVNPVHSEAVQFTAERFVQALVPSSCDHSQAPAN